MKIKDFLKKLKNKIMLSGIWDEVKRCVTDNLGMGNINEVLAKTQKKYETCPNGFPPEYFSKENIEEEFSVKTDTGKILTIVQKYLGLNFEDSCDKSIYIIYDENKEVLYDSSIQEKDNKQNKKQKETTKKD